MLILGRGKDTKIRKLTREDVDYMMHWDEHEDPLFLEYNFPIMTREECDFWYKIKTKGLKKCYAVENNDDKLIGYISLRNINIFFKQAELGIVFNPSYIDKGYGTDALDTFLKYYFEKMKHKKIYLKVAAFNKRAYTCYIKCGFKVVDHFYGEFYNKAVDIFDNEKHICIRSYFKKSGDKVYTLFYKMELST